MRARLVYASLLIAALTGLPAPPASGQGTQGMLPGPIATGELMQYGRRLELSPEQRRAVESIHDDYKREFRVLRDGDIARFMASMRTMQGSAGGGMPSRAAMDEFFELLGKVQGRIAAVDARLFDRMQPLLSEDQLMMMPRVRERRERQRFSTMGMFSFMGGGTPVDLSEVVLEMDLTPDERTASDAILAGYEHRLTAQMRKQYETSTGFYSGMLDGLEELGITESDWSDPERMQEVQEAAQQIMVGLMEKMLESAEKAHEQNRRTLGHLRPTLAPDHYRTVRDRFVQRAHPELAQVGLVPRHSFKAALKLSELTDAQRQEIETLQESTEQIVDDHLRRAMETMDEMRSEMVRMMSGDQSFWQERQEKVQKMQQDAEQALAGPMEALAGILGPELAARAHADPREMAAAMQGMLAGGGGVVAQAAAVAAVEAQAAGADQVVHTGYIDAFLPPVLGRAHLEQYGGILRLDENEKIIAGALFETYEEQMRPVREGVIRDLQTAASTLWQHDPETGAMRSAPDREKIGAVYTLRAEALAAMRSADEAFFRELDESLLMGERGDELKRVRLTREHETWSRGSASLGGFGGQNELNVDLVSVVRRQRWKDGSASAIEGTLLKYLEEITPVLQKRFEIALDYQKGNELINVEYQRLAAEGEVDGTAYQEMWQELLGTVGQEAMDLGQALGSINQRYIERLQAELPEERSYQLRTAYRQQAYPGIYHDPTAVQKQLRAAAALHDLSPAQRSRLDDLSSTYVPEYERLSSEMVDHSAGGQPIWFGAGNSDAWVEHQARQEKVARLRFDRDELNARTVSRLRDLLDEAQIARVGGLPEITVTSAGNAFGF